MKTVGAVALRIVSAVLNYIVHEVNEVADGAPGVRHAGLAHRAPPVAFLMAAFALAKGVESASQRAWSEA
jgi:hypothetical protein